MTEDMFEYVDTDIDGDRFDVTVLGDSEDPTLVAVSIWNDVEIDGIEYEGLYSAMTSTQARQLSTALELAADTADRNLFRELAL